MVASVGFARRARLFDFFPLPLSLRRRNVMKVRRVSTEFFVTIDNRFQNAKDGLVRRGGRVVVICCVSADKKNGSDMWHVGGGLVGMWLGERARAS